MEACVSSFYYPVDLNNDISVQYYNFNQVFTFTIYRSKSHGTSILVGNTQNPIDGIRLYLSDPTLYNFIHSVKVYNVQYSIKKIIFS